MKNLSLFGLTCLGTACGVALSLPANAANLTPTDSCSLSGSNCTSTFTELAIILDGSDSITSSEFDQQLQIYKSVFGSPLFYDQILKPLAIQQIAVSLFQFGRVCTSQDQTNCNNGTGPYDYVRQNIGWTLLDSQTAAETFANQFPNIQKMGGGISPLADSINVAHESLRNNNFAGNYLVMDISSDGYEYLSNSAWPDVTNKAYWDKIDAINGISIDPQRVPQGFDPILDNITSLKLQNGDSFIIDSNGNPVPNAAWNNSSNTPGFLVVTEKIDDYQQFLANKVAKETLPLGVFDPKKNYLSGNNQPQSVPEPSLLWGIVSLGFLGMLNKIRGR